MTTNEILFWALLILTWGLSLMAAYFHGRDSAFRHAAKYAQKVVDRAIDLKLEELRKKQPPIK